MSADASMRSRELSQESRGMNGSRFGGARSRLGGNRSFQGMEKLYQGWPSVALEPTIHYLAGFVRALAGDNPASNNLFPLKRRWQIPWRDPVPPWREPLPPWNDWLPPKLKAVIPWWNYFTKRGDPLIPWNRPFPNQRRRITNRRGRSISRNDRRFRLQDSHFPQNTRKNGVNRNSPRPSIRSGSEPLRRFGNED